VKTERWGPDRGDVGDQARATCAHSLDQARAARPISYTPVSEPTSSLQRWFPLLRFPRRFAKTTGCIPPSCETTDTWRTSSGQAPGSHTHGHTVRGYEALPLATVTHHQSITHTAWAAIARGRYPWQQSYFLLPLKSHQPLHLI